MTKRAPRVATIIHWYVTFDSRRPPYSMLQYIIVYTSSMSERREPLHVYHDWISCLFSARYMTMKMDRLLRSCLSRVWTFNFWLGDLIQFSSRDAAYRLFPLLCPMLRFPPAQAFAWEKQAVRFWRTRRQDLSARCGQANPALTYIVAILSATGGSNLPQSFNYG